MTLGTKLNRKVKMLGNKIDKTSHRIGMKANDVLSKVQGNNSTILRKIANTSDKVKSGLDVTDSMLTHAMGLGAGTLPIIGNALSGLSGGVKVARKLVDRGDVALNKYKKASDNVLSQAKAHSNELEKFNVRKAIENATTENDGFA